MNRQVVQFTVRFPPTPSDLLALFVCRWISLRVDFAGGLFAAALAAYLIYVPNDRALPSDTGFSLTMASTHALYDPRLFLITNS
jgi:hypothetical protein